jgi:cell division protease FtsH
MSLRVPLQELPVQLTTVEAVGLAHPGELADLATALRQGLPCLVECPKELTPCLYANLRQRLHGDGLHCVYLDGRAGPEDRPGQLTQGALVRMYAGLREAVRGPLEKRVLVLPYLDLMTGSAGGLSTEAREVFALLLENPELVWLGFRDPELPLPRAVEGLALYRLRLLGVERERLARLVTRAEGRKFGAGLDLGALHRQVSGVNAVRLRKLLSTLDREDLPADPACALAELRRLTLAGGLTVPEETLAGVGGYARVKQRLADEVLAVLERAGREWPAEERRRLEGLVPRGLLLTGPPGGASGCWPGRWPARWGRPSWRRPRPS